MKAARFTYHAPTTVREAVDLLAAHAEEAKVVAGGQSLVPLMAMRIARFDHLVDLNRVEGLDTIERDGDDLVLGAMVRQRTAESDRLVEAHVPLLHRALPLIGHFQIRNRGTIGGSLSHADPASELPAVARCLDATFVLEGPSGIRHVAASDFFTSVWQTATAPDEILTHVRFPLATNGSGYAIEELALRHGDFAIAGAAAAITVDGAAIARAAVTLFGMDATPVRARSAEASLVAAAPGDVDAGEIARLAVGDTHPTDDVHASAEYRRRVASGLVAAAVASAIEEARNG